MLKVLPLLKYLKRESITPEALQEILAAFGMSGSAAEVAPIANAFRERGPGGLTEQLPALMKLWTERPQQVDAADVGTSDRKFVLPVECPNCGRIKRVTGMLSQLPTV